MPYAPFPHRYTVTLEDRHLVAPPRAAIDAGPPPQFGGSDKVWSPEELLIASVLECLWTTFQAYARREGLEVHGWRGDGVGVLDKGKEGPTFTGITLTVEMTVASADEERARRLLVTAEDKCIIARAVRVPIALRTEIHVA